MDASSRALFSNERADQIEKFTNGSEIFFKQDLKNDFRHLRFWVMFRILMRSKLIYNTSWTYFFLVLAGSTLNEIFPLWLVIPSTSGGFGFNSYMLGLTFVLSGLASLGVQVCCFPIMAHQYGLLPLLRTCLLIFSLVVVITPSFCIPFIQSVYVLPEMLVISGFVAMTVALDWALVIVYVFINNSCYEYQRATVNGLAQALACVAMMFASLSGSSFFALCESNILKDDLPWPFHYAVVFWIIAVFGNIAKQSTYRMHRKIQKSRREPHFPRYAVQMETFNFETKGSCPSVVSIIFIST